MCRHEQIVIVEQQDILAVRLLHAEIAGFDVMVLAKFDITNRQSIQKRRQKMLFWRPVIIDYKYFELLKRLDDQASQQFGQFCLP